MNITFLKSKQTSILKCLFIIISILFIIPSIFYLIQNGTILGFKNYYNFFINDGHNKTLSTIVYLVLFIIIMSIYLYFINKKDNFKNIKQVLLYAGGVSAIFVFMLPWNSSDIFYYMGVGELNSVYRQNPYYVTIKEYCNNTPEVINEDSIMEQGNMNFWAGTTVVYGPIAQIIFSFITKISFKNVNFCIFLFKIFNLIIHILNCYIIYKITKKLKFSIIYGLNPYVMLEFIGMVHNDIIVVFFVLLALYFLLKKKMLLPSVTFLAIATGIKYFTVLLLPVVVLYYYKDEKSILKRLAMCFLYGIIFIAILLLEYMMFFKDISIFKAMMVQTDRYCKSIYSGIYALAMKNKKPALIAFGKMYMVGDIVKRLRNIVLGIFVVLYIKFCIDLLLTRKIKINNTLRKYNLRLVLFILALSNFQQWYLLWLFATMPWQKPNTIRNIIGISAITQIANSIYMFKEESYLWDVNFDWIIIFASLIWIIATNKNMKWRNKLEKVTSNRWK